MHTFFTRLPRRLAVIAAVIFPLAASAQFTNGNLEVLQVGLGANALTSAATSVVIREFTPTAANQTTAVKTVYIDTTGSARLTLSGSASSEGHMTLSADSSRLVIGGYDAPLLTTGIASTTSASVARAIDTLSALAIPGRADTTQTAFSGNNIRAVTRAATDNFWAVGGTGGVYYMGNATTPATIQSSLASLRFIIAANGKLYYSSSSGTSRIYKFSSQPTTATTPDTLITLSGGIGSASPVGFAVNSAENVVYVADDRSAANGGGIQKWTLSGTTWSLAYTLATSGTGARSVIADWSGTTPVLYVVNTSATGTLLRIVDSNALAAATTLAAGGTNTVFRSVTFAPRPCAAPALSISTTPVTCAANGAVTLTTTGGTGPFTYAYSGPGAFSATTPNISNLAAGTYTLVVTANGGCTGTGTVTVANNATITATATATGSTTRCQRDSVLLTANAGTGYHYQWKLNAGALNARDTMQTYKAGTSGNYTVTVTSGINCSATSAAVAVTINPLPATTVTASGPLTFCTGGRVILCVSTGTGYTYQWRRSTASGVIATTPCDTATVSGVYKVFVTTALGCSDTSAGTTVTAGAAPTATLTPSATINICQGDTVRLRTNSTPGLTYAYLRNGAILSGAGTTDSILKVTLPGIYRAIVSAGTGCTDTSARDTVVVNPLPATGVRFITGPTVCGGDTVRVRGTGSAGNMYQWSITGLLTTGLRSDSNFSVLTPANITTPTIYTFRLIVQTAAGCRDSSALQTITVNPLPAPVIANTSGTLSVGTFSTYQWYLNGLMISGATGSTYTPVTNGTYAVQVSNTYGCSAVSSGYVLSGLSVANTLAQAGIRLYPNPAKDVLRIEAPYPVIAILKDLQGREVARTTGSASLNVAALSDGLYAVTVYKASGELLGTQLVMKSGQ